MIKNNVELSIDYIKIRIPDIINNFHTSLINKADIFLSIINEIYKDRSGFFAYKNSLATYIQRDNDALNDKYYSNLDALNSVFDFDPIHFLYHSTQGKVVGDLLNDYYQLMQKSKHYNYDGSNDIDKALNNYDDDHFNKGMNTKTPFLVEMNISNMSTWTYKTLNGWLKDTGLPKIAIKSVMNSDIVSFTQSDQDKLFSSYSLVVGGNCIDNFYANKIEDRFSGQRKGVSELLVGQIDMATLSQKLLKIYYLVFHQTFLYNKYDEEREQILQMIKSYQVLFGIENSDIFGDQNSFSTIDEYNKITEQDFSDIESKTIIDWLYAINSRQWRGVYRDILNDRNPYCIFVFINKFLNLRKNTDGSEIEPEILNYIDTINELLDKYLNTFINRCILSTIITFFAKIGQNSYISPQGLNHDFIKKLIQITIEDTNNLNMELSESPTNYSKYEDRNTIVNSFEKRKTSQIIRKRIFDYLMLCNIIKSEKDINYNHELPFANELMEKTEWWDKDDIDTSYQKGSPLYKFVVKVLQEIYSNATYTINTDRNIIGYENGKYVYKSTMELAAPNIKKYLNDYDEIYQLKEMIENSFLIEYWGDSYRKPSFYLQKLALNSSNSVEMVSLINHRSLASIYKVILHLIFKLLYVVGNYQEMAKNEKIVTMPPYLKRKYMEIIVQINNVINQLNIFNQTPDVDNKEIGQVQYVLNQFQSGKWMPLHDNEKRDFTNLKIMSLARGRLRVIFDTKIRNMLDNKTKFFTDDAFRMSATLNNKSYFNDDIISEFDLSTKITDFLIELVKNNVPSFSSNAPETMLMRSYESIREYGEQFIKNIAYHIDYKKSVSKFEKYLNDTSINSYSLEELMTYGILNDGGYKTLDKKDLSLEEINEFQTISDKFDEKFLKAITSYSVN